MYLKWIRRACLPAVLLPLLISCAPVKEPLFRGIQDLRISRFGFDQSALTLKLSYYNPNKSGLKLKHAEGDAWANDELLGHFMIDTLVTIPPKSDFEIPLKMNLETGQFLRTSMLTLGNSEISIRIDGHAKVGKGRIFIGYPIRFTGSYRMLDLLRDKKKN